MDKIKAQKDLHEAIIANDLLAMEKEVREGADVNGDYIEDYCHCAPLSCAMLEKAWEAFAWLAAKGARYDEERDWDDPSELLDVIRAKREDCAASLLTAGFSVDFGGDHKRTPPVAEAAKLGLWRIVKMLIDAGAELNEDDNDFRTALYYAAGCYDNGRSLNLLINAGAKGEVGSNPLENVYDAKRAALLLEHGRFLDKPAYDLQNREITPLCHAVENNRMEVVEFLLAQGADPCFNDNMPMLIAAESDSFPGIIEMLYRTGASLEQGSPLAKAAASGSMRTVKKLVELGATPDYSAVAAAVANDRIECLDYLLKRGAAKS